MCGRYSFFTAENAIKERFHLDCSHLNFRPRYNIAPSQLAPVVLDRDPEKAVLAEWGFIPFWAKSEENTRRLINARVETVSQKPTFKEAFLERRCLVLADGFYEWQKVGSKKIPFRIALKNDRPFAFAGIWQEHENLPIYCIITCLPNLILKSIHNRMPVILEPDEEILYLNRKIKPEIALGLLDPYPVKDLVSYPISTLINKPEHDGPEVIKPLKVFKTTKLL